MSAEISNIESGHAPSLPKDGEATLACLLQALASVVPVAHEDEQCLDDTNELVSLIAKLTQQAAVDDNDIGAHLGRYLHTQKARLSPRLKAQLLFWQTLFDILEKKSPLDLQLLAGLQRLRPALLMFAMRDSSLLMDRQHSSRRFLDCLLQDGAFWYPQSGKEGATFYDAFAQAVESIISAAQGPATAQLEFAVEAFVSLVEKQKVRAGMMEQRCGEGELGMAKIHRAQKKVIELLDSLNGCAFPETVLAFVRTILKGELQFILINQSETAGAWQSWNAIIKRIPQVFPGAPEGVSSVEPEPPNRPQLYRDVQVIVGLLDEHVTVSAAQQQSYDDGVEDLRERLFEKLRGISVPLAAFDPLSVPDELSRVGAAVSPSLLKKAAGLQVGDWFLFNNNENQLVRCKLLLRPPEVEQLLFVNRSGHRVLQKSVQDFSACLATRIATPLPIESYFDQAFSLAADKLQALVDKNNVLLAQAKAQHILAANAAVNSEALEPAESAIKADSIQPPVTPDVAPAGEHIDSALPVADMDQPGSAASDRKSAAQKARQEARVLAKLKIRRERQRLLTEPSSTPSSAVDAATSDDDIEQRIASLHPGAWVELPQADGDILLRCKLVAIMRSSNTYIFADRRGVKVAEHDRTTLAALLANNSARIISSGDDFEGQLSKVVLTLRRDT